MCAVHYFWFFFSILDGPVSCGMHQAIRCSDCPGANGGPPMCNGQCKWDYALNACLNKGKFDTSQSLPSKFKIPVVLAYSNILIFIARYWDNGRLERWY